jgi:hypothetical protein
MDDRTENIEQNQRHGGSVWTVLDYAEADTLSARSKEKATARWLFFCAGGEE